MQFLWSHDTCTCWSCGSYCSDDARPTFWFHSTCCSRVDGSSDDDKTVQEGGGAAEENIEDDGNNIDVVSGGGRHDKDAIKSSNPQIAKEKRRQE